MTTPWTAKCPNKMDFPVSLCRATPTGRPLFCPAKSQRHPACPPGIFLNLMCIFLSRLKRGQTCTFQTCTLFSDRFLALTTSRLPSMPFPHPALLSIASLLSELKWAITSAKKDQEIQRCHEEQSARSKGARLSALDSCLIKQQSCRASMAWELRQDRKWETEGNPTRKLPPTCISKNMAVFGPTSPATQIREKILHFAGWEWGCQGASKS